MIFAGPGHVLLLHIVFSFAIVRACSGGFDGFWLILWYIFLVCMSFCILLFSVGSRCSCVAFSRSRVMSKFICLSVWGLFVCSDYVVFYVAFYGFVL